MAYGTTAKLESHPHGYRIVIKRRPFLQPEPKQIAPKSEPMDELIDHETDAPAKHLEGLELPNGWTVRKRYVRTDGLSAGKYSVGYFVERNGEKGFLKALDFSRALKDKDVPKAMLELVQSFEFERNVLRE